MHVSDNSVRTDDVASDTTANHPVAPRRRVVFQHAWSDKVGVTAKGTRPCKLLPLKPVKAASTFPPLLWPNPGYLQLEDLVQGHAIASRGRQPHHTPCNWAPVWGRWAKLLPAAS